MESPLVQQRWHEISILNLSYPFTNIFILVIGALRKYPKRIKSYEEALGINGIGSKTAEKVCSRRILESQATANACIDHGNCRHR
jgi:hypothetical protein